MVINIELPDRWKTVNLGDVLSYIGNGLTNKQNKANDGYPVTRIETISDDCINAEKVGYVDILTNDKIEKYRLYYGDVLISHINSEPQLGRAVIYEGKPEFLLHGMNLLRMRADTKTLDPFFLNLIFKFYRSRGVFIALASRAVGQASINQSRMKSLMIPLPPLPEQRTIAHVLQTIQEAKFTRQREIALERERKAALMDFLFSHGTKGEPRKQTEIGEIPESWGVVSLGDIADITYGVQAAVAHLLDESVGLPILTNINITLNGTFDLSTLRYYELPEDKKDKLILKKGDLLFNWRSGSQHHVGKTVLFDLDGEYTFSSFILRFRFAEKISNIFAFHYFHYLREKGFFVLKRSQSSVNSVFNASKSAKIPVVVPSIEEQLEIGGALQTCDIKIAALEKEAQHIDELFHTMLDELMTGQRSAVPLIDQAGLKS